jgi:hypothetical protein
VIWRRSIVLNIQDSYVLANYTFVSWGGIGRPYMQAMMRTLSRNNLYIVADDAPVWTAFPHRSDDNETHQPDSGLGAGGGLRIAGIARNARAERPPQ